MKQKFSLLFQQNRDDLRAIETSFSLFLEKDACPSLNEQFSFELLAFERRHSHSYELVQPGQQGTPNQIFPSLLFQSFHVSETNVSLVVSTLLHKQDMLFFLLTFSFHTRNLAADCPHSNIVTVKQLFLTGSLRYAGCSRNLQNFHYQSPDNAAFLTGCKDSR